MKLKTYKELFSFIQQKIDIAIENTCYRLLNSFKEIIASEFYIIFDSNYYSITLEFCQSEVIKIVNKNCRQLLINMPEINYEEFYSEKIPLWTTSFDSHNNNTTSKNLEYRFQERFKEFCNCNVLTILKEELKKQGINIKTFK